MVGHEGADLYPSLSAQIQYRNLDVVVIVTVCIR